MTYGHLQADCLYTGISSGPNARCRVWEAFNFFTLHYTLCLKTSHLWHAIILTYTIYPITIIFGWSVTEKVRHQTMFCFPTSPIQCISVTLRKRKPRRQRSGHCVQHSPTAAALSTSFLPNHVSNSPELNALITRFRESYSSVSTSCDSKRMNKSSSGWLNSGNSLIQHLSENAIFVLPRFAGSAEAQVI